MQSQLMNFNNSLQHSLNQIAKLSLDAPLYAMQKKEPPHK